MADKDKIALDFFKDHATALGLILGHWANLETNLTRMMEYLLQIHHKKVDFIYDEFVSTKSKIILLQRINEFFTADITIKHRIGDLLSLAFTLNSERNYFVHARWIRTEDTNKLTRIISSPPQDPKTLHKKQQGQDFTSQEIQSFVSKIAELSLSFQELLDQVMATPIR